MSYGNEIYYRLYISDNGRIHIVEMQPNDELDYDQNRFVSDIRYPAEQDAESALNKMIVLVVEHMAAGDRERTKWR